MWAGKPGERFLFARWGNRIARIMHNTKQFAIGLLVMVSVLALGTVAGSGASLHHRAGTGAQTSAEPKAAAGKTTTLTKTTPASKTSPELSAADAEVFLGGLMPTLLEHNDVAGAVVIVVKDGKVLFSHGYGYADVKSKKPVSVDDTLFRPGSISKLFTCTAIMQLVEQGKLDLDRDVNDYLDFKIPPTYAQPITLRRIMTHTAGFEEWGKDLFVPTAGDLEALTTGLPGHLPARIFPPATMPAYSNYAMTVAGYIVQRVSGERFEDYIANHIYKPLGMTHATFVQPLPADLQPLMSSGYALGSGGAQPFEFVNGPPAGSMSVSAGDIAHFMIAHLQDGRYGDVQILKPETARLMHSRAFGPVAELNGMALAFFQENQNGHIIVGHGGDTRYFHSHLSLVLDSNVGFFISLNSAGRGDMDIRSTVWSRFLDRYFPEAPPMPPAVSSAVEDAKTVSGNYITSRRGETNFLKMNAMMNEVQFVAQADGSLVASQLKGANGQARHWREIGPLIYRAMDSQAKIAFVRNSEGQFDIFTSGAASGFQGVGFTESQGFILFLFYFGLVILGLMLAWWPSAILVRWHFGRKLDLTAADRRWRILMRGACVVDLLVVGGWLQYFNALAQPRTDRSLDSYLTSLQVAGWIGVIGTLVVIFYALRSWGKPKRWLLSRIGDTAVALGCLALVWLAWICNFLHIGTKF